MKKTKFVKFLVPLFALLLASCAMTPQDLSSSSEPGAGESSSAEPSSEDHSSEDPSSEDVSEETSSEDPSLPDSSDPGTSEEDPVEPGSSEDVPGSSEEDPVDPGSSEDVPGSSEEDPDQPGSSNPEVSNLITVYFKAPENWGSTINAYAWGDSGSNASWPGVAMQDQGDRLYSYELDYTVYPNIIFNDGTSQTGDLKTPTDPDMALYVNGTGWVETGSDIDPEITLDGWYIVGEGGFVDGPSWKPDGGIYLAPNESYEGEGSEYFATDVKFTQGDLWKICSTENVWVDNGYESDVGAFALKQMEMDGQNIKVLTTGLYDVYFKISSDNAYSCYISEEKSTNPDEPDVPGTDEGHNASEVADIIKETAHATNGTVDYSAIVNDDSNSVTYKTTGDVAVLIMDGQTSYAPNSHNQYHLGYIHLALQCASNITFEGFTYSNGVYKANSATVTLSSELYLRSAYAAENEKFGENIDIQLTEIILTLNGDYVDTMKYTSPSLAIGKSATVDGGESLSKFMVNEGMMMTCAFGFYDIGKTTIAPNSGEGGGEGDEPVDTLIDIFFVKPTNWAETINAYAWDDKGSNNATWPGVAMNNLGDGLYHIELDYTVYPNIIFNDGSNQTGDLKTPTDPDMSLYVLGTGWIETGSDTPEIKEEWFIVGEGSFVNEKTWSYEGGIYLAPNESYEGDGEEYYATDVKFTEGDLWKVCSMNGTWIDKGYESDNGAFAKGEMVMDGQNIKVTRTAVYDIYFKVYSDGTTSCYISEGRNVEDDPVEEVMSLAGKTFEIYKVEGYENIPEDMGGPASVEAMIGETITFNEDGTFILTANGAEAYGTYTQDGEKGTYTQKGVYVGGNKMEMPEELWMTHDIMISGEEIILKSYVGNLDDVNLYPYLYAKLVG